MSKKKERIYSEIPSNMNNLGMAMEKLAIIRWITVPFNAIISLFLILIQIPNIIGSFDYFDISLIWIPIVFGILYIFVSFSTLLRFVQFTLNLWNLGKNQQNALIKRASIYQLIRIGLLGFVIGLSIFLGAIVLIPLYQYFSYRPVYLYEMSYRAYPDFNVIAIAILSLLLLILIVVMKVFNILSIVSIDNWAERRKLEYISNESIHQLRSGTNLMKTAVFLELVNILFGSIFFNIGLFKAGQGFKKFSYRYPVERDKNDILYCSNCGLEYKR
ncbi:hypothetical protein DSAG12_00013 [Promethearchaeum syntrophicum]|uniref:Uncharacterized protein n=1 Tax=Promethearchaeum syntrophicum TaxID=2594042 RepID=A0A5B9D5G5_9ARCH|nr:hypothetical protein [Candidatus Prometheoarchaeum syntrophicum]QEE14203.1 hypothetical protein DSAG12_00013 [Candidatus Prometheoarchaeum syntrophicum]